MNDALLVVAETAIIAGIPAMKVGANACLTGPGSSEELGRVDVHWRSGLFECQCRIVGLRRVQLRASHQKLAMRTLI